MVVRHAPQKYLVKVWIMTKGKYDSLYIYLYHLKCNFSRINMLSRKNKVPRLPKQCSLWSSIVHYQQSSTNQVINTQQFGWPQWSRLVGGWSQSGGGVTAIIHLISLRGGGHATYQRRCFWEHLYSNYFIKTILILGNVIFHFNFFLAFLRTILEN